MSFRGHTRKLYEHGALKGNVTRFPEYKLQVQMQAKLFERATQRLGNKKDKCVVAASFCTCALISNFYFAKKGDKYSYYRKGLLKSPR